MRGILGLDKEKKQKRKRITHADYLTYMGGLSYIYFWRCFLAVFHHSKVGALQ